MSDWLLIILPTTAFLPFCSSHLVDSLENWNGVTRNYFDAIINPQDLADTYFPAFMSCANRGNASGLMCSCK